MMKHIEPIYFNGPYYLQTWSFPDSIIYYITKNPSTETIYQKLIESCKYFFCKNPIIVIERLCFKYNQWKAYRSSRKINTLVFLPPLYVNDEAKVIDFKTFNYKLWITFEIYVAQSHSNNTSSIIQKLYRVDAKKLELAKQILSFNEFKFLSSNIETIVLWNSTVMNRDGSIVPLENLIKVLSKIQRIVYECSPSSITSNTIKEIFMLPHFSNITQFALYRTPEAFDIDTFSAFMKKNTKLFFTVLYGNISEAFKKRVEAVIDEIIATKNYGYLPPGIHYPGIDGNRNIKLHSLRHRYERENFKKLK